MYICVNHVNSLLLNVLRTRGQKEASRRNEQSSDIYEKIKNAKAKHSDSNTGITMEDMVSKG